MTRYALTIALACSLVILILITTFCFLLIDILVL
jgi:hypothetical protein